MINTYGVFGLTGKSLGVITIAAIVTLAVTVLLYYIDRLATGITLHLISFTLMMVGVVSWWTAVDWSSDGSNGAGFGTVLITLVLMFVWLYAVGGMLRDKLEGLGHR